MSELLEQARLEINRVDEELVRLLGERMRLVDDVIRAKKEAGLPVLDSSREGKVLERVGQMAGPELSPFVKPVFSSIMDMSKCYQHAMAPGDGLRFLQDGQAGAAAQPLHPRVACQGSPGAFSGEAAQRMYPGGELVFVETWDDVFQAVQDGSCDFGVLPVENSLAGSVGQVYDLLMKYRFTISRACRLPVVHNLLGVPGSTLDEISEIYSHPQALAQCAKWCSRLPGVRTIPLNNTASASKMVAGLGDPKKAAISSAYCAGIYGLEILASGIQTDLHNATRFVSVSKNLIIPQGANRVSLIFSLPHEVGSLNRTLAHFSAMGLNLTKIESRPAPESFHYLFYLDFAGSADSGSLEQLIGTLSAQLPDFAFLGNYIEE
ncbi:MAG: prephenate dehydratase domain-containing protein [Oscillospiraceae bacterium]|nr:prephenate dehydratase domain-containing protein [Oscillospiraceae bacterium]